MPHFRRLCEVTDIPAGESRMFVVNETMLAVFNRDGELFVLSDVCPHAGASLALGIE
jgi:nitrite reductase/ring-hydroxylating ferredoxin subunit